MSKGHYTDEKELARIVLAVYLRQMNRKPRPQLSEEERDELHLKNIFEDMEWGARQGATC